MRAVRRLLVLAMSAGMALPILAAEAKGLNPGTYEVTIKLALPHLENMAASKVASICVTDTAADGTHGLVVLSENNPLGKCPASNAHEDGDTLTFDIKCPGGNAAIATATYTLLGDRFNARITMKMGGKNMTMTETQTGHRTGDCPATAPRS